MTSTTWIRSVLLLLLTSAVAFSVACEDASPVGGGTGSEAERGVGALVGDGGGVVEESEDVTWPAGSEIPLEEDLIVRGQLLIEHGVVVTADAGVGIFVADGGSLVVDGRASSPVLFTGSAPDRWAGIAVESGGDADIDHAIVERIEGAAVSAVDALVRVDDTVVRDVTASTEGGDARGLSFVGGEVSVTDTVISGVVAGEGAASDPGSAGENGDDGAAGERPDEGDPVFPVAGGAGTDGAAGPDGEAGGEATGIFVGADTSAVLAGNHIEQILAGAGGSGGAGGAGGDGGSGGGGADGQDGAAGGAAGFGATGGLGGDGGAARGIWLDDAALVEWLDNRVDGVVAGAAGTGGDAGAGGTGGAGGAGGDEVIDPDSPTKPGAGAAGGDGGNGGAAGAGGAGGIARAVHTRATDTQGLVQSELANVAAGAGGASGAGADGGAGGVGGVGGDGLSVGLELGGAGGNGGQGGAGGDGQDGGMAGLAVAIEVSETADVDELVTASTVLTLETAAPGDAGSAGTGGAGGVAGEDGTAPGEVEPRVGAGKDGLPGEDGVEGMVGAEGLAAGVAATSEAGVVVQNSIFELASPDDGVGLLTDETSGITSNSNLFWQLASLGEGDVTSGARDRIEDPRLVDAANGDARLAPDSPAIDAGDNAFLPTDVIADIDGEARPVDDPGTDDTGSGDDRPVVDIGAHEFQPPSCDVDPHELWPPNHKFVTVAVDLDLGSISLSDPDVYAFASSNEPDNDKGDGNTTGDVNGQDGYTSPVDISETCSAVDDSHTTCRVDLRSERAGPGNGRVYTIGLRVVGEDGSRETECEIVVPHDQSDDEEEVEEPDCDPDDDDEVECVDHHEHGD